MTLTMIETDEAPIPAGHYSQAVCANGFVYVAGLLPIVPKTNREIPEGVEKQAEQVFANLRAILRAADSDVDKVVSVSAATNPLGRSFRAVLSTMVFHSK